MKNGNIVGLNLFEFSNVSENCIILFVDTQKTLFLIKLLSLILKESKNYNFYAFYEIIIC